MKKLTNKGKIFLSVGIVATLTIGGTVVYSQIRNSNEQQVQAQQIELYTLPSAPKVFVNGVIEPKETKTYSREDSKGIMSNMQVKSGDTVKEGQWLFSYKNEGKEEEAKGVKEEITQAQVDLDDVKKELQQLKAPTSSSTEEGVEGPTSEQMDYLATKEALEAQVKDYTKQIQKLNTRLTAANNEVYTKVVAPFAGVVHMDESKPDVAMILDSTVFILNGKVSEQDLLKVKVDMPAEIFVFSTEETVTGNISSVSTRPLESGGESGADVSYYQVKLTFGKAEKLISGLHAQAKVQLETPPLEVPVSAVLEENEKYYVFVDENGMAKKTEVKIKIEDGKYIVTEGLKESMAIVKDVINSKVEGGSVLYPTSQNGAAQNE